jgi:uncharacterized lipoprotein YddW (UPF0748 family)
VIVAFSFDTYLQLGITVNRIQLISEETIDHLLGLCIRYRIDTLYVPVVSNMEAFYDSRILPRSSVLINNGAFSDFDPLRYIISKGKRFNVFIVPVVDCLTVWPSKDFPVIRNHVSVEHPEWLSMDSLGRILATPAILDPGVPDVQAFLISLLKEILLRYNIPAIALEHFEYPNGSYGYNPYSLKEYEKNKRSITNATYTLNDFRIETLSDLLSRFNALRDSLGVVTNIHLITETDPKRCKSERFQDWLSWINSRQIAHAALWYWFADVKTVRYDTLYTLENLSSRNVFFGLSPNSLMPEQLELLLKEITSYPIKGVVVDTFDEDILEKLNSYGIGIPR